MPTSTSRARSARRWPAARLAGLGLTAGLLVLTLACIDRPMKRAVPDPKQVWPVRLPQAAERDVDILFVIDNSGSMADEQALLQAQFSALMQTLRDMRGGLPNVHIGVTSTDLGTGAFTDITYCDVVGGDAGRLLTGGCPNPQGNPFIVDTEPAGCDIEKTLAANGSVAACGTNTCTQAMCPAGTTLGADEVGCPRCRNYGTQSLEDVFSCMAGLGTFGCGFEQPLEAMYKALDPANTANAGFIRENAFLAVVLITDEDDCSAASPQLFDPSQTDMNSTLGPLTSYRCFEFGITCDQNARTSQGLRSDCVPREDAGALLHPVSRYVSFLQSLKPAEMIVVAAIAGPVNNDQVTVGLDDFSQPEVQFSCSTDRGGAVPGIRIRKVIEAFNKAEDLSGWAYTSICSPTYSDALTGVANKIAVLIDQCPPAPFTGCADPGVSFGLPGDGRSCNDACAPSCTVIDQAPDSQREVPSCLEVCAGGPCPGNADPLLAYEGGHPSRRDPQLPVEACWHVNYNEQCVESRGGELVVARRADPPPRTVAKVSCSLVPEREELCNDGKDNDEDCLVDLDDPDCQ